VCCGVVVLYALVVTCGDDCAVGGDEGCADGDAAFALRFEGLLVGGVECALVEWVECGHSGYCTRWVFSRRGRWFVGRLVRWVHLGLSCFLGAHYFR